jgi:parallel beta-helix repeat protein
MNAKSRFLVIALAGLSVSIASLLTACGGGGGSSSSNSPAAAAASTSDANAGTNASGTSVTVPDTSQPMLTIPTNLASGSVVQLQCGRVYQGTLNVQGESNITVQTTGTCGNATITAGQPITGWTLSQGNIYSASIAFNAAQVLVDGQPISLAHWPNRAQTWAQASSTTSTSLTYAMPNTDLVGANLVFKPYDWSIEARTITAYVNNTMTLASTGKISFDGYALNGQPNFYVEGKLWMLNEPGEWAVSNGRLYVWTPDGQSPEGRVWASPDNNGIEATNSSGITVNGVNIYGTSTAINALGATNLHVSNTNVANSSENGILNYGGSGLQVNQSSIVNSRHDAIAVKWGGGNEVITNSRIDSSGVIGMPTNAHAAINLTASNIHTISNNTVTNSGYVGIRFFRNATLSQNTVDGACLVLTDCGGVYSYASDQLPLNATIDGNTIKNVGVGQKLAWAVYLSDYASSVVVRNNTIAGNGNGMMIFDGFNNTVTGNTFSSSSQAHLQMGEDSTGNVRNNVITGNTFIAKNGEQTYRLSSDRGVSSVAQFATYNNNIYANASTVFANYNGNQLNYTQWKSQTGQDSNSILQTP